MYLLLLKKLLQKLQYITDYNNLFILHLFNIF
jgi:hypothetical protein